MLSVLRSKLVKKGISMLQFYREAKLVLMLEIRIFIKGLLNVGHKYKIRFGTTYKPKKHSARHYVNNLKYNK